MKNDITEEEITRIEVELYNAMHDDDPEAFYNTLINIPHNKFGMLGLLNFCEAYDHPDAILFFANQFSEIAIQNEYRRFYYLISRARYYVDGAARYEVELIKDSSIKNQSKLDIFDDVSVNTLLLSNVLTEEEKKQLQVRIICSKLISERKELEIAGVIENCANFSFGVLFMYNLINEDSSIYTESYRFKIAGQGKYPFKLFIPVDFNKVNEGTSITLIADIY